VIGKYKRRSRDGYEWEEFNHPNGKMTIGDAHADSDQLRKFSQHQLLRIPPYKNEGTK
jgi:hypothetical protein